MEIKKEGQAFFKGMNKDFSPAYQPEGTYRNAINMELTGAGEQMIFNPSWGHQHPWLYGS